MPPLSPTYLTKATLVSPMGCGVDAVWDAILAGRSGLIPCNFEDVTLNTYIGRVRGVESFAFPQAFAPYDNRANRLVLMALAEDGMEDGLRAAIAQYGAKRVGLLVGTSTSGTLTTEHAYRHRDAAGVLPKDFNFAYTNDHYAINQFLMAYLGLEGVSYTVSTACSSSARICSDAMQLLACDLCDAVILVGVDSLCLTTLYGFNALELLSPEACTPFDKHRKGISIGEAAAVVLVEKSPTQKGGLTARLLGYGESSDGYHMSSPHPEGKGALLAMQAAIASAGLKVEDIDYINLHGTATPANDSAEDKAVSALGNAIPCSSTKGWTGHTLGAAGLVEVIMCMLALHYQTMPACLGAKELEEVFKSNILQKNKESFLEYALSNSFGFGGNNCSLLVGR
jgi:3-oxoacyl-[acyl-carrier-protein] synthase-1